MQYMRSERSRAALLQIRENILLARQFIDGMTLADFRVDLRAVYAVVRCLEIVSEASRRVEPAVKSRHPHLPWTDMAGAGNIYRHDYERVRPELVWKTVVNALPELLRAVETELQDDAR